MNDTAPADLHDATSSSDLGAPGVPAINSSSAPAVLDDVHFGYTHGTEVLRGVTAALRPGRLTVLLGPNAAGKTTLLRLILGQIAPTRGRVTLAGRRPAKMTAAQRAAVASYVPQRGVVSFAFTVRQVVAMGRFARPRDDAAVDRALEACDLQGLSHRVFAELSGGQQQRVLVARALAQQDGGGGHTGSNAGVVMLLDEPVGGMDLWHVHRTMDLLRRRCAAGLAALVSLHDLDLAAAYADDVWLLSEGKLAASGGWERVLRPEVLQPVYRVPLAALPRPGSDRPLLVPSPGAGAGVESGAAADAGAQADAAAPGADA